MFDFRRTSSQLKRAALLGGLIVALAHSPPFYLAQRIDGTLLDAFAALANDAPELLLLDPAELDAMPAMPKGTRATILAPNLVALGPLRSSIWSNTLPWLLALGGVALLLGAGRRRRPLAWATSLAAPSGLLALSAASYAGFGLWVPVAGPASLLLATGVLSLRRPGRPSAVRRTRAADPAAAAELLQQGELEDAWLAYSEIATTRSILPELHELGRKLAAARYTHLAADAFLRVALVDPHYQDVAERLVRAARPGSFSSEDDRRRLRAEMPARLGRYRLLEPIGCGTMGRVYLGQDPKINRLVAIKQIELSLKEDAADTEDTIQRFLREAETTGRLNHPNIVTVYDVGESDGGPYIAMQFLKGELLSDFASRDSLLPVPVVLELGAKLADALDYAHSQNVIHRDIKPANIMYDSVSGDLKITDFGIARLIDADRTRTGIVLGTPSFMSPEQIEGGNVKGHTDLFALGVSLYELLTGQLPFRENSMTKLMFVIANEPHEPVCTARPDLPAELDGLIDVALHKDPASRFRRGADMAAALRSVASQLA